LQKNTEAFTKTVASAIADTIFRRKIGYLFFSPRIPLGLRLNCFPAIPTGCAVCYKKNVLRAFAPPRETIFLRKKKNLAQRRKDAKTQAKFLRNDFLNDFLNEFHNEFHNSR
jgi:hypothetical protein